MPSVEHLVLGVYRAVREVGRIWHDVEDTILRDTEPLRYTIPHALPAPATRHNVRWHLQPVAPTSVIAAAAMVAPWRCRDVDTTATANFKL